ncbi:prepilin-type N-terminal cleavage/methylation domain-containing protein [Acinetobacter towneri]|uniref:GspH/FimT family pseudopilin n=1 Tax=Acinetobacter towneri TaxID=202956 RepID=UPI002DBAA1EF|nr:GspH/FimT family pseudopilin [Acinetobacter towneri]MEB6565928.1 prepilin-type N-terminal cleavage/methylation domain-containing protein [Acinetobacter towneri]
MSEKNSGFTLVELMVAIAVLAVIATLAVPSFSNVLAHQSLKKTTLELKSSLQEARSQALLTRASTIVCLNKNASGVVVDEDACGAELTGFSTMATSLKASNIKIVNLDDKVSFDSSVNDDFFVFDARGTTVEKSVKLCAGSQSYTLKIFIPGTITVENGAAC